jgi:S1-C subfamily serine protease
MPTTLPNRLVALGCSLAVAAIVAATLPVAGARAQSPPPSAAQGVVDITTRLTSLHAEAAGTGMLLNASGEVLTNNHVIRGGSRIRVTVPGGRRYRARVVGTDARKDIAVLQIEGGPPAVAPVSLGDSSGAAVGQPVTAVGNAGGRGGAPSVVTGSVVALHRSITALDDADATAEHLTGMIEVNAPIRPGDSGGPLLDAAGQVIGMDTAAASGSTPRGYAIPIDRARAIASRIVSGQASAEVHIGAAAFLGVDLLPAPVPGAVVVSVSHGSPAAAAGLSEGDVVTALGGVRVHSAAGLGRALAAHHPGDKVRVRWVSLIGASHTANVRLGSGPPA